MSFSKLNPEDIRNKIKERNIIIPWSLAANVKLNQPEVSEGNHVLLIERFIWDDVGKRCHYVLYDEEGHCLMQNFKIENGICINLAKFIKSITGELSSNDFDLESLCGTQIEAIVSRFYTNNGYGYANIALCWSYEEDKEEKQDGTKESDQNLDTENKA